MNSLVKIQLFESLRAHHFCHPDCFWMSFKFFFFFFVYRLNGIQLIADCFDFQDLPVIIAHALITIVCNLKMWLNVRSIITLFFPLRAKVLRYMCQMSDKDLRSPAIKLISGLLTFEQIIILFLVSSWFHQVLWFWFYSKILFIYQYAATSFVS